LIKGNNNINQYLTSMHAESQAAWEADWEEAGWELQGENMSTRDQAISHCTAGQMRAVASAQVRASYPALLAR